VEGGAAGKVSFMVGCLRAVSGCGNGKTVFGVAVEDAVLSRSRSRSRF